MNKKLIRLTESDLHRIVKESINILLNESIVNHNDLIKDVLFNGDLYNVNNKEGYDIGVGYSSGTKKEFFYPYSERMEYSYCHVTVDEINKVVDELKNKGYEFEIDNEGYVFMKGERNGFKPFVPMKPYNKKENNILSPSTNPVEYYTDKLFKDSKDGNLHLF